VGLVIPELKYAITKALKPTKWDSRTMWHRGAIDVVLFKDTKKTQAAIFDYKTGQMGKTVTHKSQLMLYALIMFILYPNLQDIQAAPIYLDHKVAPFYATFKRSDFDMFFPRWVSRFRQVTDATVFPARPNAFNCRFCQHKAAQPDLNQVEPACAFGVF
jgi:RecB family exonuclease